MPSNIGEFEQLVLLALIRLGDDAYGLSVHKEIAARTGRPTTFGTVYSTLARLEGKGLIDARLGEPTAERGGRRKKHFRINADGRRAIRQSLRAIRQMTRGVDGVESS